MHWKVKAAIQNTISALPPLISYSAYYRLQRLFGGLKDANPGRRLVAGIQTWNRIVAQGINPVGKVFFEVGTGHAPIVPLAYWLMGADRTITVDVNPYMRDELVRESLDYIHANRGEVSDCFGELLQQKRLDALLHFQQSRAFSRGAFLDLCRIEYFEPADAAATGLPSGSIDFHTSYTVFEHIPRDVLANIIQEGNRIVRDDGLFVHMVDYSDHFSHSDSTISAINFLKYSDDEWRRYAGNRYTYVNRLRHDDILDVFESAGHAVLATTPDLDENARELLRTQRICLDGIFRHKSPEILAIRGAWIVSAKRPRPAERFSAYGRTRNIIRPVG
jgi:SAM-dependent methyltransferase